MNTQATALNRLQSFFDTCAVLISALCALHCLALPVLLIASPLLGASVLSDELFHQLLLWVIVPTSVVAVALARLRHPDVWVLVLVVMGLLILTGGALWAHDYAPPLVDTVMALAGGALLAIGHIRNFRLCKS
jgi:hypothetical protein